jgi:hypothetical protein
LTLAVLAWLWLLLALPFLTDAACNVFAGLFLFGTWLLLAVAWLFVGLVGLPHSLSSRLWWAAAVAGCLGVGLAFTDAGLLVRVALSQPWLEAYARQVPLDSRDTLHEPQWVGLFRVDGEENRGGAVFLYTSYGYLNRYGLAYIPSEQAFHQFSRMRKRPLLGEWHVFEWKF